MKRCPQCGHGYDDVSLNFCLMDGTALADTDSEPTVVIARTESAMPTVAAAGLGTSPYRTPVPPTAAIGTASSTSQPRGVKLLWWVGLVVLIIFLGAGGLIALLLYNSSRNERVGVSLPGNMASPAPKRSSTPKTSPSPVASVESTPDHDVPADRDSKDDNEEQSDEITPITWTTAAVGFKDDVGRTYRFGCPPDGTASAIWGNDVYTADSSICTAAVHAGVITLEDGGDVTIEFRPGRQIYGSTVRNGITSNTFGEYPRSFVFK